MENRFILSIIFETVAKRMETKENFLQVHFEYHCFFIKQQNFNAYLMIVERKIVKKLETKEYF